MYTCIVTSLQMSRNSHVDIPRQKKKEKKSAFPHTVLCPGMAGTLILYAVTCLWLWAQFSYHNNKGCRGWYVGLDRFPSGKRKCLTGHVYSACSTCVLHHGMTPMHNHHTRTDCRTWTRVFVHVCSFLYESNINLTTSVLPDWIYFFNGTEHLWNSKSVVFRYLCCRVPLHCAHHWFSMGLFLQVLVRRAARLMSNSCEKLVFSPAGE